MSLLLKAAMVRAVGTLSVLLPVGRTSLKVCFREDPRLAWCTLLLWVTACVPLSQSPFLPFADLGINTAAGTLLWDAAFGNQPAATYYSVQWAPVPYWTTYAFTAVAARIFGPLLAAKLLTAFLFALIPLGVMRLLLALGRDARMGLWAFVLVWEHNLYCGWLAYLFGVGLACFALAWLIEATTTRQALRLTPIMVLLALTHAQAVILVGLAGGLLAFTTSSLVIRAGGEGPPADAWPRRLAVHAVALSGLAFAGLPWLVAQFSGTGASTGAAIAFEWHAPAVKLAKVFGYTLDNLAPRGSERTAAMAFVLALLGPLLLALLPAREQGKRFHVSALTMVAVAGALYALLPMTITGPVSHWYTYPRYASVFLLWLLLVPAPRLQGRLAVALVPGVALALWMHANAALALRGFGERTRPLQQVIAHVRPGASLLSMVFDDWDRDPDLKLAPYHQLHTYVTATKRGYDPYLWDNKYTPLVYRPEARLPAPGWYGTFTMAAHGRFYDYVLVQAFHKADPAATAAPFQGRRPKLVIQSGRWRLYEIRGSGS